MMNEMEWDDHILAVINTMIRSVVNNLGGK